MPVEKRQEALEKRNLLVIKQSDFPFTQINNDVVKNLTNATWLGVYCYLCSLPGEWQFYKHQIAERFGLGEKDSKRMWSYFNRSGLIKYQEIRDEKGHFLFFSIEVSYGLDFDASVPLVQTSPSSPSGAKTTPLERSPEKREVSSGAKTHPVDICPTYINKEYNIKNKDKYAAHKEYNKDGPNLASVDTQSTSIRYVPETPEVQKKRAAENIAYYEELRKEKAKTLPIRKLDSNIANLIKRAIG